MSVIFFHPSLIFGGTTGSGAGKFGINYDRKKFYFTGLSWNENCLLSYEVQTVCSLCTRRSVLLKFGMSEGHLKSH